MEQNEDGIGAYSGHLNVTLSGFREVNGLSSCDTMASFNHSSS